MRKIAVILLPAMLSMYLFNACSSKTAGEPVTAEKTTEDPVKKGAYLVGIMGCNDCHSPKRMGSAGPELIPELVLSGYPSSFVTAPLDSNATKNGWVSMWADLTTAVGPWGQTYAANITSDSTGIGAWSEAQFKKALTEGKYKGLENERPLMPPMPWQNYRELKEDDIKSIFAYLKSTRPVKNVVPAAKLNPPPKM